MGNSRTATHAISTHTPHARRDQPRLQLKQKTAKFQLTRLMRGVTLKIIVLVQLLKFQLTRLMRGVTAGYESEQAEIKNISTHTPHARRDRERVL